MFNLQHYWVVLLYISNSDNELLSGVTASAFKLCFSFEIFSVNWFVGDMRLQLRLFRLASHPLHGIQRHIREVVVVYRQLHVYDWILKRLSQLLSWIDNCIMLHAEYICTVISSYCPASLPSPPANGVIPSAYSRSLGASAVYSCTLGFSGSPISSCMAYSATGGIWSAVRGSCTCMASTLLIWVFYVESSHRAVSIFMRIVIKNYCQVLLAPPLPSNAGTLVFVRSVYGLTSYSCNYGFVGAMFITCLPNNASSGVWSSISGSCFCMPKHGKFTVLHVRGLGMLSLL